MTSYTEDYDPKSLKSIQGHNKLIKRLEDWANNWKPGDDAYLLVGDPGVGKTTIAHALANDKGWPVVEINASSERRKEDLKQVEKEFFRGPPGGLQLVLLDEIDGLGSGSRISNLKKAIQNSQNPVIATANDGYDVPRSIKSCFTEKKMTLYSSSKKARLRKVAEKEGIDVPKSVIEDFADRKGLREAITDLKVLEGEHSVNSRTDGIGEFESIRNVLTGSSEIDEGVAPESFIWWLDENWRSDGSNLGKDASDLRGIEIPIAYHLLGESDKNLMRGRSSGRFRMYSQEMQKLLSGVRRTEAWHPPGKDPYINVNYPQWFRSRKQKSTGDSSEAKLYRRLKKMGFHVNFEEFKDITLPILASQPEEEKMELALEAGIDPGEGSLLKLLDVSKTEYSNWRRDSGSTGQQKL